MILRVLRLWAVLMMWTVLPGAETFFVTADGDRSASKPDVAIDAKGNAVLVWTSMVPGGAQPLQCIRIRRVDPGGNALGKESRIDAMPGDLARNPSVDISADGRQFVVAWEGGSGHEQNRRRIWARVFGSDGLPVGADIRVDTVSMTRRSYGLLPESYSGPRVSIGPSGRFVVVWRSEGRESCDRFNISARHFSAEGGALGGEFLVNEERKWSQLNPDIDHDPFSGRFIIVWRDGRWIGTAEERSNIRAKIFDENGAAQSPVLDLSTVGASTNPRVAAFRDGGFVTVWTQSPGAESEDRFLRARGLEMDGHPSTVEIDIEIPNFDDPDPTVSAVGDSSFVISWVEPEDDRTARTQVKMQGFARSGRSLTQKISVSPRTCRNHTRPSIGLAASGTGFVSWQSNGPHEIQGRRFAIELPLRFLQTPGLGLSLSKVVAGFQQELRDRRTDPLTKTLAAQELGCMGLEAQTAFDDLARCLKQDETIGVRSACAEALTKVSRNTAKAVPSLENCLEGDDSAGVREAAALAIGDLGASATEAIPSLVTALEDPAENVRGAAGLALGNIEAFSAIELLVKILEEETSPTEHSRTAQALGKMAEHRSALRALRSFGDQCIRRVETETRSRPVGDSLLRFEALRAFLWPFLDRSYSGDSEKALRTLNLAYERLKNGKRGVNSPSEETYRTFFEVIDRALDEFVLRESSRTASQHCGCLFSTASGLSEVDPLTANAASLFKNVLRAAPPECRLPLLQTIEEMGPRATRLADEILPDVDSSSSVRKQAIRTIVAVNPGSEKVVPALRALSDDPDPEVRAEVVRALIVLGARALRRSRTELTTLLDDDHRKIRQLAEKALDLIESEAQKCSSESELSEEHNDSIETNQPKPTTGRGFLQRPA